MIFENSKIFQNFPKISRFFDFFGPRASKIAKSRSPLLPWGRWAEDRSKTRSSMHLDIFILLVIYMLTAVYATYARTAYQTTCVRSHCKVWKNITPFEDRRSKIQAHTQPGTRYVANYKHTHTHSYIEPPTHPAIVVHPPSLQLTSKSTQATQHPF